MVLNFVKRQSHNYRMILVRSAGAYFMMNLTSNYFSIYTTGLGADSVTLGGIRSVSSAVNTLISLPSGWISDNYNLRKVMGAGMAIQSSWSPSWLIVAWIFMGIGMSSTAYDIIALELVPPSQRGRWLGITNAVSSIARIPAPLIGGLLYQGGTSYRIFLIPLLLDMGLRMPLLAWKTPETGANRHQ